MIRTRPSLPLYARDWLADTEVTAMGTVARAIYMDLLCRCWIDGSIPAPDGTAARWAVLAALGRATAAETKRVWPLLGPHFIVDDEGRLRNRRLERHRQEAEEYAKRKAVAGLKGAQSRWQTHGTTDGKRMRLP